VPLPLLVQRIKPVPVGEGWQRKADGACHSGVRRPDEDFEYRYSVSFRGEMKKSLLVPSFSKSGRSQTPPVKNRKGESRFHSSLQRVPIRTKAQCKRSACCRQLVYACKLGSTFTIAAFEASQDWSRVRDGQLKLAFLAFLHAPWVGSTTPQIVIATAELGPDDGQRHHRMLGQHSQCDSTSLTPWTASLLSGPHSMSDISFEGLHTWLEGCGMA